MRICKSGCYSDYSLQISILENQWKSITKRHHAVSLSSASNKLNKCRLFVFLILHNIFNSGSKMGNKEKPLFVLILFIPFVSKGYFNYPKILLLYFLLIAHMRNQFLEVDPFKKQFYSYKDFCFSRIFLSEDFASFIRKFGCVYLLYNIFLWKNILSICIF